MGITGKVGEFAEVWLVFCNPAILPRRRNPEMKMQINAVMLIPTAINRVSLFLSALDEKGFLE